MPLNDGKPERRALILGSKFLGVDSGSGYSQARISVDIDVWQK